ncbi:hypothetical protein B0J11DRAFT_64562 [Dendryphion nanum]|uniref:MARVEL domain-containing protein n=1 Tax=Dendryphion nanum TaxID=256645 RepID=A0A9P9DI72_9PLEO|nr:hypothetical protein B0J11DRAFT_64562 [Dendryphion nanum]
MFTRRAARTKPTAYPFLPFHAIRTVQLVSALVVSVVMGYFLSELSRDNYPFPWTFLLLLAVSVLTFFALTGTIILHCFYGLNPRLNMILNAVLLVLWSVAFGLLVRWTSGTLAHICKKEDWEDDTGMMVCRVYKALFSFSLFGLISTLVALILDIRVQRKSTARGTFAPLPLQRPDSKPIVSVSGPILGSAGENEANPNPTARKNNTQRQRGGNGYAIPDEQFTYDDDTGYHGAGQQVNRRSLDERV